jgi:hypothetical protein
MIWYKKKRKKKRCCKIGVFRESNSGPLAPEARIIPLDQTPSLNNIIYFLYSTCHRIRMSQPLLDYPTGRHVKNGAKRVKRLSIIIRVLYIVALSL